MQNTDHPQTNGGRLVKRGDTFDPECHRTTHRLGIAQQILHNMGVESTFEPHQDSCMLSEKQRFNKCFGYNYYCSCPGRSDSAIWPEWATGRMFDLAFELADELQDSRGSHNRAQAAAKVAIQV